MVAFLFFAQALFACATEKDAAIAGGLDEGVELQPSNTAVAAATLSCGEHQRNQEN